MTQPSTSSYRQGFQRRFQSRTNQQGTTGQMDAKVITVFNQT